MKAKHMEAEGDSPPSQGDVEMRSCLRTTETQYLSTRSPTPISSSPPLAAVDTELAACSLRSKEGPLTYGASVYLCS